MVFFFSLSLSAKRSVDLHESYRLKVWYAVKLTTEIVVVAVSSSFSEWKKKKNKCAEKEFTWKWNYERIYIKQCSFHVRVCICLSVCVCVLCAMQSIRPSLLYISISVWENSVSVSFIMVCSVSCFSVVVFSSSNFILN